MVVLKVVQFLNNGVFLLIQINNPIKFAFSLFLSPFLTKIIFLPFFSILEVYLAN